MKFLFFTETKMKMFFHPHLVFENSPNYRAFTTCVSLRETERQVFVMNERIIGIKHRIKRTKEGEARPTLIAILDGEQVKESKLDTEDDEIDFIFKFQAGDTVAMPFGGSGDYLAYAIARQLEKVGGRIIRLKPAILKEQRGNDDKANDHLLVARLAQTNSDLFQPVTVSDLQLIELQVAFRARQDAMKARIACEQRLFQRTIGLIFIADGLSPESSIEKRYLEVRANDRIYLALEEEEKARDKELQGAVRRLLVWKAVFESIEGVGPRIAGALIAAIGNIKNFRSKEALKQFCGVAVTLDGNFPRFRTGEVSAWSPTARQALYLLGDQFNRRPESDWGKRLLEYKRKFHEKYPEPVIGDNGKKRYTPMHLHRRATWRTLTKFVEHLYREWSRLDRAA